LAKNGLIVSYYFPPTGGGGVQRWLKFTKYLSRFGWNLTVIADAHHPRSPRDESLLKELPQAVEIIRIQNRPSTGFLEQKIRYLYKSGYWQRWLSAFFNITDSRKSWNKKVLKVIYGKLANKNYDAIIITSPPYSLVLLAAELTDKVEIPVYLDFRDPWTLNPYKIYPTIFHRLIDRSRETAAIKKIKNIISAYQAPLDDYKSRIEPFSNKRTLLLPNGYDESDFVQLAENNRANDRNYNIGFSGSVYSHLNTPHMVFRTIKNLNSEGYNIHFHHVGTSVYDLNKLAQKFKIEDNIHLWGYKSHWECLEILNRMDALCLILDDRLTNAENTIGGKFYEYLRLQKPIFAIVPTEGEAAKVIRKTNSGVIVSANDMRAMKQILKKLIAAEYEFSWENIDEYNREKQAQILRNFLEFENE
jgi:hypothetical protein